MLQADFSAIVAIINLVSSSLKVAQLNIPFSLDAVFKQSNNSLFL